MATVHAPLPLDPLTHDLFEICRAPKHMSRELSENNNNWHWTTCWSYKWLFILQKSLAIAYLIKNTQQRAYLELMWPILTNKAIKRTEWICLPLVALHDSFVVFCFMCSAAGTSRRIMCALFIYCRCWHFTSSFCVWICFRCAHFTTCVLFCVVHCFPLLALHDVFLCLDLVFFPLRALHDMFSSVLCIFPLLELHDSFVVFWFICVCFGSIPCFPECCIAKAGFSNVYRYT